jgi:hypothetical protein
MEIEKFLFTQHLLVNKHSYGSVEDIMDMLHITRKGSMNTLERVHIYIYIYIYIS